MLEIDLQREKGGLDCQKSTSGTATAERNKARGGAYQKLGKLERSYSRFRPPSREPSPVDGEERAHAPRVN
jgi:hypothetical protein